LAFQNHSPFRQSLPQFSARYCTLFAQDGVDQSDGARVAFFTQSKFGVATPTSPNEYGSKERQQPAQICSWQQMQGASESPRADNRALFQASIFNLGSNELSVSNADRQDCTVGILSLDTDQVADNLMRIRVRII
jgi:hypothetical protein